MNKNTVKKKKKGFTLVELIATVAVLAVISTIAIVAYRNISLRAKEREYEAVVGSIKAGAMNFYEATNVNKFYVQTLIDYGILSTDDASSIIKNPVDDKSMNCYIVDVKETEVEVTKNNECTEDLYESVSPKIVRCDGTEYDENAWHKEETICLNVELPEAFQNNGSEITIVDRIWENEEDGTFEKSGDSLGDNGEFIIHFDGTEFSNTVFDGRFTVKIILSDPTLYSAKRIVRVKNDLVKPEITYTAGTNCGLGVPIHIDYTDIGSGLVKASIKKGLTGPEITEFNDNKIFTYGYYIENTGIYTMYAEDKAGNHLRKTYQINTNKTDYDYTLSISVIDTDAHAISSGNWIADDFLFKISANGWGNAACTGEIYYCIDDKDGSCTPNIEITDESSYINGPSSNGKYYIHYYAKNRAGIGEDGIEKDGVFNINIDKDEPVCFISSDNNTWTNKPVTIRYGCDESVSLLSGCHVKNRDQSIVETTYGSTTDEITLRDFTIVSGAGIEKSCTGKTIKVNLDTDGPDITTTKGINCGNGLPIHVTYTDNDSGLKEVKLIYGSTEDKTTRFSNNKKFEIDYTLENQGTYTLYAKDNANNEKTSDVTNNSEAIDYSLSITVQTTGGKAIKSEEWISSDFKFKITTNWGNNACKGKLYYCASTSSACKPEIDITNSNDFISKTANNGTYYINYKAVNRDGVTKTGQFVVNVDKNDPVCTHSGDSTTWTNSNRTIYYGCNNSSSNSGCLIKNQNVATASHVFDTTRKTATISAYTIVSGAGKEKTCPERTANVYVDKKNPTINVSGGNNCGNGETINVTYEDSDSGLKEVEVEFNGTSISKTTSFTNNKSYQKSYLLTSVGTYTIKAKDNANNSYSTTYNVSAASDYTLGIQVKDTNNKELTSESWISTDFKFKISVGNWGNAACAGDIYYCVSTSSNCNPTTKVNENEFVTLTKNNGTYYINYKSENDFRNPKTGQFIVKVDKSNPTCTHSGDNATWTNSNRTIYYGCNNSSSNSGCLIKNQNVATASHVFDTTRKTATISAYTIVSGAGKEKTCPERTANVYVDKKNPTINVSGGNNCGNGETINVTYEDSDSGLKEVEVEFNGTSISKTTSFTNNKSYQKSYLLTSVGTYTIKAKDNANNSYSTTYNVSAASDYTLSIQVKDTNNKELTSESWINTNFKFKITATGWATNCAGQLKYCINNSSSDCADNDYNTFTGSSFIEYTASNEGTYYIHYKGVDKNGDSKQGNTFIVKIDRTAPVITSSLISPADIMNSFVSVQCYQLGSEASDSRFEPKNDYSFGNYNFSNRSGSFNTRIVTRTSCKVVNGKTSSNKYYVKKFVHYPVSVNTYDTGVGEKEIVVHFCHFGDTYYYYSREYYSGFANYMISNIYADRLSGINYMQSKLEIESYTNYDKTIDLNNLYCVDNSPCVTTYKYNMSDNVGNSTYKGYTISFAVHFYNRKDVNLASGYEKYAFDCKSFADNLSSKDETYLLGQLLDKTGTNTVSICGSDGKSACLCENETCINYNDIGDSSDKYGYEPKWKHGRTEYFTLT